VLDIMLPGRNGFQVCRDLRAGSVATPILVLTAKDGDLDEAEALDTGADDYLRKPFSLVVLVARIRALIRRGASRPRASIEVGDLVVDPGRLTVRRGDAAEELTLTPREFAVLELLARRSPDVVPKSTLLDTVWGLDFPGDPNIVEVYVGYLRKKLGRDVVRTVRGVGYQLQATP
jgi:two-component system OmpR family response regulator